MSNFGITQLQYSCIEQTIITDCLAPLIFPSIFSRKPYRYFAYDCANTFPNIPPGPPQKHTDVICTRKYSEVAPSTGGEVRLIGSNLFFKTNFYVEF